MGEVVSFHNPQQSELLDPLTADVVYLRYVERYPIEHVSRELGLAKEDARRIATSALQRLRELHPDI